MTYALAVDPDAERVRSTASVMGALGLEPKVAADGVDALDLLRKHGRPALLVTELVLPRLDGFVLLRRLRALSGSATRVIVLSSSRQHREAAEQVRRELGIDALLSGATSPQALLRVGRLVLGPTGAPLDPPSSGVFATLQKPRSKMEAIVLAVAADFGLTRGQIGWAGSDEEPQMTEGPAYPLRSADGSYLGQLSFHPRVWNGEGDGERIAVLMREIVREIDYAMPAKLAPRRVESASA